LDFSAVNDAPTPTDDERVARMGTSLTIDPSSFIGNDTDSEDDPLTYLAEFGAINGTVTRRALTLDETGDLSFMLESLPDPGFPGDAAFTYRIADGRGGEDTAELSLTILPRNDAPIVRDGAMNGFEDLPLFLSAARAFANDSGAQGDLLFFSAVEVSGRIRQIDFARAALDIAIDRAALGLPTAGDLTVTGINGAALPVWLTCDAETEVLSGAPPDVCLGRIELECRVAEPAVGVGDPVLAWAVDAIVLDPTAQFTDADGDPVELFDTGLAYGHARVNIFDPQPVGPGALAGGAIAPPRPGVDHPAPRRGCATARPCPIG
jgi:hypothetical protein